MNIIRKCEIKNSKMFIVFDVVNNDQWEITLPFKSNYDNSELSEAYFKQLIDQRYPSYADDVIIDYYKD